MAIPEDHIQKVMGLLAAWNPLGDRADSVKDLDNYRSEAIDILFTLDLKGFKSTPTRIIRDVLNQAFDLSLSLEECMEAGRQILEIVSEA
jgi:hypothetical protein